MAYSQHQDHQPVVMDFVYDAVIANPDSPKVFTTGQLYHAGRPGIKSQRSHGPNYSPLGFRRQFAQLPVRRRPEKYLVLRHGLFQSQSGLDFFQWYGAFFLSGLKRGFHVGVVFQRLEQLQIFNRNHGRHAFVSALQHYPLAPVSYTINHIGKIFPCFGYS
jgi:hypothetical protein